MKWPELDPRNKSGSDLLVSGAGALAFVIGDIVFFGGAITATVAAASGSGIAFGTKRLTIDKWMARKSDKARREHIEYIRGLVTDIVSELSEENLSDAHQRSLNDIKADLKMRDDPASLEHLLVKARVLREEVLQ